MIQVESSVGVLRHHVLGAGRCDSTEVEALGERDQVAGEAVAAEVTALPRLLGVRRRERGGEWPSAFGAAPVVPALGWVVM